VWRSTELARPQGEPPAEKREADEASSASDDAGIPDEAANPAGIRTDGAPTRAAYRRWSQARYHGHCQSGCQCASSLHRGRRVLTCTGRVAVCSSTLAIVLVVGRPDMACVPVACVWPIPRWCASVGAGTLLEGEHSPFVIELLDPGRRKVPAAASLEAFSAELSGPAGAADAPFAVAGAGDGSGAACGAEDGSRAGGTEADAVAEAAGEGGGWRGAREFGADARGLGSSQRAAERRAAPVACAANNAASRRVTAFRAGLARAVAAMHASWLARRAAAAAAGPPPLCSFLRMCSMARKHMLVSTTCATRHRRPGAVLHWLQREPLPIVP